MSGLWRSAIACLIVLVGTQAVAGEPEEVRDLVAKLKASLGTIKSVQATYRTYFSPKTSGTTSIEPDGHAVPGAIAGPDGLVLYSEFDWAWQASPYREAIDGKWGYSYQNKMIYTPTTFCFDGAKLQTFSRESKGGLIKPLDETFTIWRNPLRLIGIGFGFEHRRDLDTLLTGAKLITLPDTPAHLKVLRSDYRDYGQNLELTVWIDTTHGYLPRRIEVREKARNFVTSRIVNEEIREVSPSVWMLQRGSETNFFAAKFDILHGMKFVPGMLGMGTQTYIVDPPSLRLNAELPRGRFEMNYPEDARLYDSTHNPPLQYKFKASRTPEEWREVVAQGEKQAKTTKSRQDAQAALIGKQAVAFPADATWINSKPLTLADLSGKVVLLDFWAEWCGPCRNDLKGLGVMQKKTDESGITIIGVHTVGSDRASIDKIISEFHLDYPIVVDTPARVDKSGWGTLFGLYSVSAIPHAVLIDRRGKVVASGDLSDVFVVARRLASERQVEPPPR